jgi:hypothetical protein
MNFGKHNWVCSLCGQGLTRKSTAIRHNNNLHFGSAMIVRPHDYIIGRLNGTFFQSDPSLYRHDKRGRKNVADSIYHNNVDNKRSSGAELDGMVHESDYGNTRQQQPAKSNNVNSMFYDQSGPPYQTSHNGSDTSKMSERLLKLKELEILVNKHFSPQNANTIRNIAATQVSLADDVSLDINLAFLRNIDRAKSY